MDSGSESKTQQPPSQARAPQDRATRADSTVHPAWLALMQYCRELRHGEIERLSIQDGLPVIAEHVRKKVKFKS